MLSQASAPSEPLLRHSIQSTRNPEVKLHDLTLPLVGGLTRAFGSADRNQRAPGVDGLERRRATD